MAQTRRRFLLGFVTGLIVGGVGVAIAFSAVLDQVLSTPPPGIPKGLEEERVLHDELGLQKELYYANPDLGHVTDMLAHDAADGPGFAFAGTQGVVFLTHERQAERFVRLRWRAHVDFLDADGDGEMEFMDRGAWCCAPGLFDASGDRLWTYKGGSKSPAVDDMAAADIDGDGAQEFVVGFNGGGGVHLLDDTGQVLWERKDSNVWHVEFLDTDGDGTVEIVHSNAKGLLTVRDLNGEVVARTEPRPYFSHFSPVVWPDPNGPTNFVVVEGNAIWIVGLDGQTYRKLPAPHAAGGDGRSVTVYFAREQPPYLATLVHPGAGVPRSMLFLHDFGANLLYAEVLTGRCEAIAVVRATSAGGDSLLIGCDGEVWQYKPVVTAPAPQPST